MRMTAFGPVEGDYAPGSLGNIFRLIRAGTATTRPAIGRLCGLAPSTVSLRVDALKEMGLVVEAGDEDSQGGRRARRLKVAGGFGVVAVADIGANHAKIAIADMTGLVLAVEETAIDTVDGPAATVEWLWTRLIAVLGEAKVAEAELRGIAIGLPAPIEYPSGKVILPSFMPSWDKADLPRLLAAHTEVPVLVENDANLMALAELAAERTTRPEHLLAIKLGSRIGCGILTEGRLHRGAGGAAGEISHTSVSGRSATSCTCASKNCLESVASGGALAARLRAEGYDVKGAADVVELGRDGDPGAIEALREAGSHIGTALSAIVNFFNPREVVLGGTMSASPPLVATIRAELFKQCLPLVANDLEVRASANPADAGIHGAIHLILEYLLAPGRIEQLSRAAETSP